MEVGKLIEALVARPCIATGAPTAAPVPTTLEINMPLTLEEVEDETTKWAKACFGMSYWQDKEERHNRFFEEAIELVQSSGMTREMAHKLVDIVFDKPIEQDINKEFAGVLVTYSGMCYAYGVVYHDMYTVERNYRWASITKIREKQRIKSEQGHSVYKEGGWDDSAQETP